MRYRSKAPGALPKALGALFIAGILVWAGTALAREHHPVARHHVIMAAPQWNASYYGFYPGYGFPGYGYGYGVTYNPYYCYYPGTCVFGYSGV